MLKTSNYLYIENSKDLDYIYKNSTDYDVDNYYFEGALISHDYWDIKKFPIFLRKKFISSIDSSFKWVDIIFKDYEMSYLNMEKEYSKEINRQEQKLKDLPSYIEELKNNYEKVKSFIK